MTVDEMDARCERREKLVHRMCEIMGWPYQQGPIWAGLRKIAMAEAVPISLEKLAEVIARLEELNRAT